MNSTLLSKEQIFVLYKTERFESVSCSMFFSKTRNNWTRRDVILTNNVWGATGRGELNSELEVYQLLALDLGKSLASVSPSAKMDSVVSNVFQS